MCQAFAENAAGVAIKNDRPCSQMITEESKMTTKELNA
jgi:hypothetical protein